ncbi:hypothetical protein EV368DRAFT_62525 [Lentinula lateritia]|nr:hypothetical protein EV368DRAFT_62525 [Lentinula lateritia]
MRLNSSVLLFFLALLLTRAQFQTHSGHIDSGNAKYQVLLAKDKTAKERLFKIGAHVGTSAKQSFISATTDITRRFNFEVGQNVISGPYDGPYYHGWVGDKMVTDENSIEFSGGKAAQSAVLRSFGQTAMHILSSIIHHIHNWASPVFIGVGRYFPPATKQQEQSANNRAHLIGI